MDKRRSLVSSTEVESEQGDGVTRRSFLKGVGALAVAGVSAQRLGGFDRLQSPAARPAAGPGTSKLVQVAGLYRDLDEQNFFRINDGVQYGAQLFGHQKAEPLIYSNSSTTEESVIAGAVSSLLPKQLLALNAWDNTEESALTISHLLAKKGYFVTQWNKPPKVFPWQIGPQWVAHIQFDSYGAEVKLISEVAKALGGKGGICYVQGLMTTTNAQQHWAGVQAALKAHPGLKLLAVDAGNWDEQTAFDLAQTWLSRYGTSVKAICSANDEMALGIQEAVSAVGRLGPRAGSKQVHITGADGTPAGVQNVAQGNWVATALFDSFWQGVVGAGLAYKAATGQINPSRLSHFHRAFNGPFYIITKANTAKYLHNFPNPKSYNFNNLWSLAQSPVTT